MLVQEDFEAEHINIQSHDLVPHSAPAGRVVTFSEWNSDSPVFQKPRDHSQLIPVGPTPYSI